MPKKDKKVYKDKGGPLRSPGWKEGQKRPKPVAKPLEEEDINFIKKMPKFNG